MKPTDIPGIRNIAISGRIASGTTTLAKNLGNKLNWEVLEGGELFRAFHEKSLGDLSELAVDKRPDKIDLDYEENIKKKFRENSHQVIQSHLAGFDAQGIEGVFKILVICEDASGMDHADIRIDRLANRKKISVNDAKKEIIEREENNLAKWRRMYADNDSSWVYWDPKYYDLVVNTYSLNTEDSLKLVLEKIGYKKA